MYAALSCGLPRCCAFHWSICACSASRLREQCLVAGREIGNEGGQTFPEIAGRDPQPGKRFVADEIVQRLGDGEVCRRNRRHESCVSVCWRAAAGAMPGCVG